MLIIWTTHREVWFKTLKTSPVGQNGPQCSFGKNGLNAPAWHGKMANTSPKLPKTTKNYPKCAKKTLKFTNLGCFGNFWVILGYFE